MTDIDRPGGRFQSKDVDRSWFAVKTVNFPRCDSSSDRGSVRLFLERYVDDLYIHYAGSKNEAKD